MASNASSRDEIANSIIDACERDNESFLNNQRDEALHYIKAVEMRLMKSPYFWAYELSIIPKMIAYVERYKVLPDSYDIMLENWLIGDKIHFPFLERKEQAIIKVGKFVIPV